MSQHRHKSKRSTVREPSVGKVGASLELPRDLIRAEPTAFQFDRRHPGFSTIILCHEQIVASGLPRKSEVIAIKVYQEAWFRRTCHRHHAPLFVALEYVTPVGDLSGHMRNESCHFAWISCSRLYTRAPSLYRASLTLS